MPPQRVRAPSLSYFVPDAGAIVRVVEGRADVGTSQWSLSFDGELATDVAALAGGKLSPRLAALAAVNANARAVVDLQSHRWVPLTALDALRLTGFDTLFIELLGTCNERCLHCYAESGPKVRDRLSRTTIEQIIDDGLEAGFQRIQFTGGDPLLCEFLPDLVRRAAGYRVREIYTNGMLLDDALLDQLAPSTPSFAFSYYSSDPNVHDAITRTPGSHRRTRAAIARTVARGLGARVAVVVMNENVATIDETVEDLRSIGVESISLAGRKSVGRGSLFGWQPKAVPEGVSAGHRADGSESDGKLAVTYTGQVVPCIFNRSRVLGHVDDQVRLRDVLANLALTPGEPADDSALSCGSCRITDFALSGLAAR